MADARLSALTSAPAVAAGDLLYLVDVSDATEHAGGSSFKVALGALFAGHASLDGAVGVTIQAYSFDLELIAALAFSTGGGLLALTGGSNAPAARSVAAGSGVGVTNGDGVSGNPTVSLNVAGLTGESAVADADAVPFYDATAAAHRKVTVADLRALLTPPGLIAPFAGGTVPSGFLECDGSAVSRTTYDALFAAIGTTWGSGNGSTTFNLPDLRGRTLIGAGTGPGLTARMLGTSGGAETHTLTTAEIPSHSHTLERSDAEASGYGLTASSPGFADRVPVGTSGSASVTTGTAGSGDPHSIMPPFAVVKWVIKT